MLSAALEKFRRSNWLFLLPISVLYLLTAPHTVTFEDAGLFLTTSFFGGVPHPPGYPLYTLVSFGLMKISPWSPAFTGALFSIVCGIATLFVLCRLMIRLGVDDDFAKAGSFLAWIGLTFWNQMIVPEVYALHIFIFVTLWWVALKTAELPSAKNFLFLSVLLGLGFANHWPLLVISGPLILFALSPVRGILWRKWPYLLVSILIPAIFYGLMCLRSQFVDQYLFLGSIQDLSQLKDYILRSYYKLSDSQAPFMPAQAVKFFCAFLFHQFIFDLSPFILIFLPVGARTVYRRDLKIFWSLVYGFFSVPIILAGTLRFEFNILNWNVMRVFYLMPHLITIIFVTVGFITLYRTHRRLAVVCFAGAIATGLVVGLLTNNLRDDDLAEGYARMILDSLPQGAKLFAATDADVGPLAYVNGVMGHREDVSLLTQTGVFFKERMFDPYEFGRNFRIKATRKYIFDHAPVFSTKKFDILDKEKDLPLSFKYNGIYYLIDTSFISEPPKTQAMIDQADLLARSELNRKWLFNWPYHRNIVMARLCNLLVLNGREGHPAFTENSACRIVLGKHLRAQTKYEQASQIFRKVLGKDGWWMISSEQVDIYLNDLLAQLEWANKSLGTTHERLKHVAESVEFASQAFVIYSNCDNPIYEIVSSISPRPAWGPKTLERLKFFFNCPKTRGAL